MGEFFLVEDDVGMQRSLSRFLRPLGRTVAVGTLAEAMREASTTRWTGVIIDVSLPDGNGLDVLEELRVSDPLVPALVLTGHLERDNITRACRLGARFAMKPSTGDEVRAFAVHAIDTRESIAKSIARGAEVWQQRYRFTPSERAILEFVAAGKTTDEIARLRNHDASTARKHGENLAQKSGDLTVRDAAMRLLRELLEQKKHAV